ncbi:MULTISPECIES: DUF29 family protein [unclassified Methylobacterium]|uniref:DUF29 family protein n=1 Tax=unclassified Methylobacterium TaxID=2615210 RepID=UPI0036FAE4C1
MDRPSLYDDDIVTWAEEPAALRALAARSDLSNAVDWENVAEEIESVGRSQIHAVERLLIQLLAHLLKRASAPDAPPNLQWRREIAAFQVAAQARYVRSMRQRIDGQRVWRLGLELAGSDLKLYDDTLLPNLPPDCPLTPDELLAVSFDADAAVLRIAKAAALKSAGHP